MAKFLLEGRPPNPGLSAWIRRQELLGNDPPRIAKENLDELIAQLPSYGISTRTRELLSSLALMSNTPGQAIRVTQNDASLAWAADPTELEFHLESLVSQGWLKRLAQYMEGASDVAITAAGWDVVEQGRERQIARAFVAMSFSDSMKDVWIQGLKPGIENAGYEAHRVDSDTHIGRIDLKIQGDIRQARFVVADATEQKQGVYYEAGFAEALGKPVIWTVRADEIDKVHFDTRQFAHILWSSPADLADKLTGVILGVLGRGPVNK